MRTIRLLLATACLLAIPAWPALATPPSTDETTTPVKNVVWLMQDNHSFDNYFGTFPGADGIPAGVCQRLSLNRDSTTGCVQPFHLGDTPAEDLGQSAGIQRRQYHDGQMDGFVAAYRRLGQDGSSSMGYYDGRDIPFHWNVASENVLFDRFFASTAVGSRESYLYWLAGRSPAEPSPLQSNAGYDALPTIFDRLAARGISAKFYVENLDAAATGPQWASKALPSQLIKVPLLSMSRFRDGGSLSGRIVDLSQYYIDVRAGTLPAVSYVVTTGASENPPAGPAAGQKLLRSLTGELMRSRYWSTSTFMWTYDGWGGWYDHVPPPTIGSSRYGFRVPALLLSPYARRGLVDHTVLDCTSMLKFIESNWRLSPLSSRDRDSAGLMSAFDFSSPPRTAELPALTWAANEQTAQNAAPVIYSVYGAAVGMALLILTFAVVAKPPRQLLLPVLRPVVRALALGQLDCPPMRRASVDRVIAVLLAGPSVFSSGGRTCAGWSQLVQRRRPASVGRPISRTVMDRAEGLLATTWTRTRTGGAALRRKVRSMRPTVSVKGEQTWEQWFQRIYLLRRGPADRDSGR